MKTDIGGTRVALIYNFQAVLFLLIENRFFQSISYTLPTIFSKTVLCVSFYLLVFQVNVTYRVLWDHAVYNGYIQRSNIFEHSSAGWSWTMSSVEFSRVKSWNAREVRHTASKNGIVIYRKQVATKGLEFYRKNKTYSYLVFTAPAPSVSHGCIGTCTPPLRELRSTYSAQIVFSVFLRLKRMSSSMNGITA